MTGVRTTRWLVGAALAGAIVLGCPATPDTAMTEADRAAIAAKIEQRVKTAYDLTASDVLAGMLSLYAKDGPVYSASGGRVTTSRDSLEAAVRQFWHYVGRNM